jgi:antitoxin ParD1/3/4
MIFSIMHVALLTSNLGNMKMAQMSISLPEELKQFAEKKGKSGDYSTPSDYIRSLIRRDKEEAWARLEAMLIEGLNS